MSRDVEVLTEYVRQALKRTIAAKYANERHELQVAVIQPKLEEIIAQSIQNRNWLVPGLKTRYRDQAVDSISGIQHAAIAQNINFVILASPKIRLAFKK